MDTDKAIYTEGKALLGRSAGAYLNKLQKAIQNDEETLDCIRTAATRENPREYLGGCIRAGKKVVEIDYGAARRKAGLG